MRAKIGAGVIVVGLVAVGCAASPGGRAGRAATTRALVPTGRMLLNDDAAMIMTKARCDRDSACGGLGEAGRFEDRDACRLGLYPQDFEALRPEACPAGVNEAKLAGCAADLLDAPCEEVRAGASEPATCLAAILCASPAEPH